MVGRMVIKLWLFGGNSNNGSNCGLAYANSNNVWSNSNSNISARLTLRKIRVCVLRHGIAPDYHKPRQQVRMYSLCWSEQHTPCAGWVSPSARGISKSELRS